MFPEIRKTSNEEPEAWRRLWPRWVLAALRQEGGVPAGRLWSLTLPVPPGVIENLAVGRWHTVLHSPDGGQTLVGCGEAFCLESAGAGLAGRFRDLRREWRASASADDAPSPAAFFAVPFQAAAGTARLVVPAVALRRQRGHGAWMTLSAFGDGRLPEAVLADWERETHDLLTGAGATAPASFRRSFVRLAETPSPADWQRGVAAATAAIADGRLEKVVLSRRVLVDTAVPLDLDRLLRRLLRLYPSCAVLALPHDGGTVVAATPERLADKRGERIETHALAGTIATDPDPARDLALERMLLDSTKEQGEHACVVRFLSEALTSLCVAAVSPGPPQVMRLRTLQHLWTPLVGRLRPGVELLDAVAHLHPSPAVAGTPRDAALDWLEAADERRDHFYTGAFGWIDRTGDGESYVVLRSAFVKGRTVELRAGAGIVAGSTPAAELAETELKLTAFLIALEET
jgi:menaquinone-specific isochorismate synthase